MGLLDLLFSENRNQPPGGLFGNYQDTLMGLGLGMAGGATPMEGFRGGLQGMMQGRASDRAREANAGMMADFAPYTGMAPQAQSGGGLLGHIKNALEEIAQPGLGPQRRAAQQFMNEFAAATQGQGMPQGMPPQAGNAGPYAPAIAGIESGGRYDAMGPVITKPGMYQGDQAFGKYQVMGRNIPQWTREVLGAPMTPQQFLASPQAQDAVFKAKFGQLAQRHGPEGAARAWFAGEGGMNNPNASDQLGTTVSSYAQKFNAGMGGQQGQGLPPQITGFSGAATAPDAQGVYPADAVMLPPGQQAAPQAAPQGLAAMPPNIRNMPMQLLFKWMMNPSLAGPQRDFVKELFRAKLEDSKATDKQKDYLWAKANGYQGTPADFMNQPSFGDTGMRDEFDRPIQGWRNPNTLATSPAQGAAPGGARAPVSLVTDLRKEVQGLPAYKNISLASPIYKSMRDAAPMNDRAADVNLIYGFAKIMDPPSVVRGEEMTFAKAVATLPQQMQAEVMSQLSGTGRLDPATREAIMRQAHSRMKQYQYDWEQASGQYKGIATRYRMNLDDVLPQFGPFEPYKAPEGPPAPAAAAPKPGAYTWDPNKGMQRK